MMVTLTYTTLEEANSKREFHSLSAAQEWLNGFNEDSFWVLYVKMSVINTETGAEDTVLIDGYEEIMNYGKD